MLQFVNVEQQSVDKQDPTVPLATNSRADGVRHRLTPEQRREIARLYSEGGSSVTALRERFNVSEPSIYRILQTQGVALRGRATATATPANGTAKRASKVQPPKQAAPNGARRPRSRTPVPPSSSRGMSHPRFACTTASQFRPDRCTTGCTPDLRHALPVHELYSAVIRS